MPFYIQNYSGYQSVNLALIPNHYYGFRQKLVGWTECENNLKLVWSHSTAFSSEAWALLLLHYATSWGPKIPFIHVWSFVQPRRDRHEDIAWTFSMGSYSESNKNWAFDARQVSNLDIKFDAKWHFQIQPQIQIENIFTMARILAIANNRNN